MAGVKYLRRIQLGVESVLGTGVAATTKWRGNGAIDDGMDLRFVQEDVGYIGALTEPSSLATNPHWRWMTRS